MSRDRLDAFLSSFSRRQGVLGIGRLVVSQFRQCITLKVVKLNLVVLLCDRNIIGSSSDIFFSESFGNLRTFSETVVLPSDNFWRIFRNLQKVFENLRKSAENCQKVVVAALTREMSS